VTDASAIENWEPVIGLEVHAQLSTESKIFCGCKAEYGAPPNSRVCPVCLGMPGVLPVLNKQSIEYAVMVGVAMNCKIAPYSRFARKNYFYPDLPKGYQISQFEEPICEEGYIHISRAGVEKRIGITRIHLEEDAGKSLHDQSLTDTQVDLNRCGVPLIEIVSEPDMRSAEEAFEYLTKLKQILRYLKVSDCNMEEGSLRVDANVSVRKVGDEILGTKTELKNMNSFRGVERALSAEMERQIEILESGGSVEQSTNLWDENTGEITVMRAKEESDDYRYFPEPDLVPFTIGDEQIEEIRKNLPELPDKKKARFLTEFGLNDELAEFVTLSGVMSDYYDEYAKKSDDPVLAAKWLKSEVSGSLREHNLTMDEFPISPERLSGLTNFITEGIISISAAKPVFLKMLTDDSSAEEIIDREDLRQVSDESEIDEIVLKIVESNPDETERYRNGELKLKGWFVGQVMKESGGKANPKIVNEAIDRLIKPEN